MGCCLIVIPAVVMSVCTLVYNNAVVEMFSSNFCAGNAILGNDPSENGLHFPFLNFDNLIVTPMRKGVRRKQPPTDLHNKKIMASSSSSLSSPEPISAKVIAKAAKTAFESSQLIPSSERVKALHEIRKQLENAKEDILEANKRDLEVCPESSPLIIYCMLTGGTCSILA